MDSTSQKLTRVISKEKQQNMDPASWKLTGEETLIPITHQQQTWTSLMEIDWGGNIEFQLHMKNKTWTQPHGS